MERRIRRVELEEVKDWRAVRKVGRSDGIEWSADGVDMVVWTIVRHGALSRNVICYDHVCSVCSDLRLRKRSCLGLVCASSFQCLWR